MRSSRPSTRRAHTSWGWGTALVCAIALGLACGRYGPPVRTLPPPPPPRATPSAPVVDQPDSKPNFDLQTPDLSVGGDNGLEEEDDDGGN